MKKIINNNTLKIIAMILMLLDHLWGTIIPGNQWMTLIGRMAFPIFAFLIVEGFFHTSDLKKYMKRLFIFGLISEIPFNLIYTGSIIFPFHQNVMFTLLLGLLIINEIDKIKNNKEIKKKIIPILKIFLFLLISIIGFVDYGVTGVLTIVVFYLFRGFKLAWIGQLISLILLYIVFFEGQSVILNIFNHEYFLPLQSIGILSLIFIFFIMFSLPIKVFAEDEKTQNVILIYNGEKGKNNKLIKYLFYSFYPVHMLVIYLIYYFIF